MNTEAIDRLEKIALAAARIDHNENAEWFTADELIEMGVSYPKNARHIAAFSPAQVLALLAVVRAAINWGAADVDDEFSLLASEMKLSNAIIDLRLLEEK